MFSSMTLEDFFTLTEMKNGLTTVARVEELICVMQRQKACATSNVGDASRQWLTVASTLASTENQDCLNHFVYLNGFYFLNQWLQEAVKYSQDGSGSDDLINVLLGSLETLPVDRKKLNASGIIFTVEKLLCHNTADIKVRAQTLFERWNSERINDDGFHDMENGCLNLVESLKPTADALSVEDKHAVDQSFDSPPCQVAADEGRGRNENLQAKTDDGLKGSKPSQGMNLESSYCEEKHSVDVALVGMMPSSSAAPLLPEVLVKDEDECITSAAKNDNALDPEVNTGIETVELTGKGHGKFSSNGNGSLLGKEAAEIAAENKPLLNETTQNFDDPYKISKLKVTKELEKKSNLYLESGEFDALEVARQVAIEVEREVVDYREQSCSSSTEVSSKEIFSTSSPPIAENKQEVIGEPNEKSSVGGKDDDDMFLEVATEVERKSSGMAPEKMKWDIDLNVDIFCEDSDCETTTPIPTGPINLSAPIAVCASKGAAAPGWAITPLHFEGELGWRGSAVTSAFRPASLRRAMDCEKVNPGLKPEQSVKKIDLNVADSESDVAVDTDLLKESPASYLRDSSSVEVSSGRAARIQLDLNCIGIGDEEVPSLQSSIVSHHQQKDSMSPSPTSSSSSRKPSARNFNLNDIPLALDGVGVINEPIFTIMGSKMAGMGWDAAGVMPYANRVPPPCYGYNGLGMGPAFHFQPSIYGNSSIPFMAEGRSATLMLPQLMGSSPISNGVESSNQGLNLNAGIMQQMEIGNRKAGNLKQFFMPAAGGHGNLLEEEAKTASQHSTNGIPLKRKEPDSGWEAAYGFGYNRPTSWR